MEHEGLYEYGRRMPRLVIADDHRIVAQGIERLLRDMHEIVDVVHTAADLIASVRRNLPDIVVTDISMPGGGGLDAMAQLRLTGQHTPFVVLSMHADAATVEAALAAGAGGYVLKTSAGDELVSAVRSVLAGQTYVTPTLAACLAANRSHRHAVLTCKQRLVLERVALGLRSREIAADLGLSVRTVESHKYAVMQVLDAHGTVELLRKAEQRGLLPTR